MTPHQAFRQAHSDAREEARAALDCAATSCGRARIVASWVWRHAACSVLVTRELERHRSPEEQLADALAARRAEYVRTIWNAGDARISAVLYQRPAVTAEHRARARRLLERARLHRAAFPLP